MPGDARHLGLAAELAFGAHLLGDPRHLRGEGIQLVHHRIDGVLELEDLALHLDGDLARQVAARDRGRHLGDVAHLGRQVRSEQVDVVGEVLPGAGDARHHRLAAEAALGADLARDARHLARKGSELVDHGVQRFLEQQDLAAHVDGDLARQVAVRDRGRDLGDVAHLAGQVAGHRVDVVGQVLPGAGDARHLGLAAELALGADLARHARHLAGEGVELVHHRVDGVLELEDLALHVDGDLAREIAAGHRRRHLGDVADLARQVRGHRVHVLGQVLPGAGDTGHVRLAAELAFGADLARHARHFGGEAVELVDHRVEGFLQLQDLAAHVDRDLARQIAIRDRGRDLGDVADLRGQVAGHRVDRVGEVLPGAGDTRHRRLAAEPALGADFARDARHLAGERAKLVDHRVDGLLQLQDLAADVDGDLLREVTLRHGGRDLGDVADLVRQVRGHGVDRVRSGPSRCRQRP